MGLPAIFFIYLRIISYLQLEAPASTFPILVGAGLGGTGRRCWGVLSAEVLCGHRRAPQLWGDPCLMPVSSPHPDALPSDPLQPQQDSWLGLVDKLNVKAFVSLTLAPSVRHGVRQLLFTSGLGERGLGMERGPT